MSLDGGDLVAGGVTPSVVPDNELSLDDIYRVSRAFAERYGRVLCNVPEVLLDTHKEFFDLEDKLMGFSLRLKKAIRAAESALAKPIAGAEEVRTVRSLVSQFHAELSSLLARCVEIFNRCELSYDYSDFDPSVTAWLDRLQRDDEEETLGFMEADAHEVTLLEIAEVFISAQTVPPERKKIIKDLSDNLEFLGHQLDFLAAHDEGFSREDGGGITEAACVLEILQKLAQQYTENDMPRLLTKNNFPQFPLGKYQEFIHLIMSKDCGEEFSALLKNAHRSTNIFLVAKKAAFLMALQDLMYGSSAPAKA